MTRRTILILATLTTLLSSLGVAAASAADRHPEFTLKSAHQATLRFERRFWRGTHVSLKVVSCKWSRPREATCYVAITGVFAEIVITTPSGQKTIRPRETIVMSDSIMDTGHGLKVEPGSLVGETSALAAASWGRLPVTPLPTIGDWPTCHRTPLARRLTIFRAACILTEYGESDNPQSASVYGCHRKTMVRVDCSLREDGEPVSIHGRFRLATVVWRVTAQIVTHHRVRLVYAHLADSGTYPFFRLL